MYSEVFKCIQMHCLNMWKWISFTLLRTWNVGNSLVAIECHAIGKIGGDGKLEYFIYKLIFVVVNFDALAQASDFRIERRQVVFLCWRQDSNPEGLRHLFASRLNACWQTNWAIEDQAKNLNSTARPYDQRAFSIGKIGGDGKLEYFNHKLHLQSDKRGAILNSEMAIHECSRYFAKMDKTLP